MPTPTETRRGRLTTAESAREYVLADRRRACQKWTTKVITLESTKTGQHYSYQISRPPGDEAARPWLVKILTGPDNHNDYVYLGLLQEQAAGTYLQHTSKSGLPETAPGWRAMAYFVRRALQGGRMPTTLRVWQEGKCGKCGRRLSTPESIERGLGPECAARIDA